MWTIVRAPRALLHLTAASTKIAFQASILYIEIANFTSEG